MKNPRFLNRVLGPDEYAQLELRGFPVQSVAASFAAKEAFSKAIGTGLGAFKLSEAQLLRAQNGAPFLRLSGRALEIAQEKGLSFSVSISHTREIAAAMVVGQGE